MFKWLNLFVQRFFEPYIVITVWSNQVETNEAKVKVKNLKKAILKRFPTARFFSKKHYLTKNVDYIQRYSEYYGCHLTSRVFNPTGQGHRIKLGMVENIDALKNICIENEVETINLGGYFKNRIADIDVYMVARRQGFGRRQMTKICREKDQTQIKTRDFRRLAISQ